MNDIENLKIHLPAPSFWPIVLALGVALIAIGVIYTLIISAVGVLVLLAAIVGWTLENRNPPVEVVEEVQHE
jgi:cytochrome c oxidase subunit 1